LSELNYLITGIVSILFLVIINLALAIAMHVKNGTFDYRKLFIFLKSHVVPYVILWGIFGSVPILAKYVGIDSGVLSYFDGVIALIWVMIIGKLITNIYDNFKEFGIALNK
jgi:hypothetical protein